MRRFLVPLFAALVILASIPSAYADGGYTECKVGDRVQDREGRVGTVVKLDPFDKGNCYVLKDGDSDFHIAIAFMLHLAGAPSPSQAMSIQTGRYACYAGSPSQYTFGGIIIQSGSTYTDFQGAEGRYSYDPGTQLISFRSGTYEGTFAKYRHAGEISLSLKPITPDTFFETVCDLHR